MGFKGYRPWVVAFLELPIIIYHEFSGGNKTGGALEVLKKIFDLMPVKKVSVPYFRFIVIPAYLVTRVYQSMSLMRAKDAGIQKIRFLLQD